jgi:hypothetical protein
VKLTSEVKRMNGNATGVQDQCHLTPEQCETLRRVQRRCAQAREIIDKCKRCNLPMDQLETDVNGQDQLATSLKREFAPDMP